MHVLLCVYIILQCQFSLVSYGALVSICWNDQESTGDLNRWLTLSGVVPSDQGVLLVKIPAVQGFTWLPPPCRSRGAIHSGGGTHKASSFLCLDGRIRVHENVQPGHREYYI